MMLPTSLSSPSSCDDDGYHGSSGMEMDSTRPIQRHREVDLLDFLGPDVSSPEPEVAGPVENLAVISVDEQTLEPTLFYGHTSDSSCEFEDVSASLFQFRTPTLTTPSSPGLRRDHFLGIGIVTGSHNHNNNNATNNLSKRSSTMNGYHYQPSQTKPHRAVPQSGKSSFTVFQFPDCNTTSTPTKCVRILSSSFSSNSSTFDEMSTANTTVTTTCDPTTADHSTAIDTNKTCTTFTPLHVPDVSSRKNELSHSVSAPNTPPQHAKAPIIPPPQQSKRAVQPRQSQRQHYHTTGIATVTYSTMPPAAKSTRPCDAIMKRLPLTQTCIAALLPHVDQPELGDLNGKMPRPAIVQAPPRRRKKNETISADELARETEERKSKSVQSARDCRQRKKQYIGRLQNAINQYNQRETTAQNLIANLKNQLVQLQRV